jgi:hypothetical protein
MTPGQFDSEFQGSRTRFAEIGFVEHNKKALEITLRGPHECLVQLGGERYSEHLSIAISGPFSRGEWIVFPFIADVIDPEIAQRLRTSVSPRSSIQAVLDFLGIHLDRIVEDSDKCLKSYREFLTRSGIPKLR